MDLDRPYPIWEKNILLYIPNTFLKAFKNFKQLDSDSTVIIENTKEIIVF